MADALASGASVRKDVGVQVPPSAPKELDQMIGFFFCVLINIFFSAKRHTISKRLPSSPIPSSFYEYSI